MNVPSVSSSASSVSSYGPSSTVVKSYGSDVGAALTSASVQPSVQLTGKQALGSSTSGVTTVHIPPDQLSRLTETRYVSSSISVPPAPVPTFTGGPFNSTIAITLNLTSPMIELDSPPANFAIDPVTGYRTYQSSRNGSVPLHFVGVGYGLNGSIGWSSGSQVPSGVDRPGGNDLYTVNESRPLRQIGLVTGASNLGEMSGLDLSAYHVDLTFTPWSNISLHNLTIHIPVKTQAIDFDAMASQSNSIPSFQGGDMSPYLRIQPNSVWKELGQTYAMMGLPDPDFAGPSSGYYEVHDGYLLISWDSEVIYKVPQNTTLVEVTGPVGTDGNWEARSVCYASLDPRPSWWLPNNFPFSNSRKAVNATNQTMFLLPLDPEVSYELHIGSPGSNNSCPVSAIRSYPFHYNFPANVVNTTNTNSSAAGPASASSSNNKSTTPIIVGTIVGIGGGLIVFGLAIWLFRRHKKNREEREKQLIPEPFSEVTAEPRSKAELERMARGEDPSSLTPAGSSGVVVAPERRRRRRGRRAVPDDDDESVIEYLPPQYREAWQGGVRPTSTPSDLRPPSPTSAPLEQTVAGQPPLPINQDLELGESARGLQIGEVDPPPLKQEYARTFGRALPRPPQTAAASGERPSSAGESAGNLQDAYKRRFGSNSQSPEPSSNTSTGDLRDEYKRHFG